ncbi:MAG: hypothetical protein HOM11_12495 [Methylococcales bacterium]|jgi:hypothetical protein|nr:hypothetical protein [Methylococcales bacterium]MBT7445069.1 hypothetical protein [Methylococcales bacterium]
MKQLHILIMGLMMSAASIAADLDSRIQYRADKVNKSLSLAEQYMSQDKAKYAKDYLHSAEQELKTIYEYYSGKFDEKHPTIVDMKSRISTLKGKLGQSPAAKTAVAETKPTDSVKPAEKLSGSLAYHITNIEKSLTSLEAELNNNKFKRAMSQLDNIDDRFKQKLKWNKGKFSPNHPKIVSVTQRITNLRLSINDKLAASDQAANSIKPVMNAINQLAPKITAAVTGGRHALMAISSAEAGYSTTRDIDKIKSILENLQQKADRINAILPNAENLVAAFRKQFPDQASILHVLPEKGYELDLQVSLLENNINYWSTDRKRTMQALVNSAKTSVAQSQKQLKDTKASDAAAVSYATGNVEMWSINFFGNIIDAVDVVYPAATANTPEVLTLSSEAKNLKTDAASIRKNIDTLGESIANLNKQKANFKTAKIAAATFPSSAKPIGSDATNVSQVLMEKFGHKPIKLGVYAPWETRTEARWVNDHWDVGTFKYLGVWMAKETVSGKFRVYRVTVRNRQKTDGSWGPLHYWSIGNSYEILKKNI